MSCSTCTKNGGCETEKGPQRAAIDEILERVYPGRVWGEPDDEARFGRGVTTAEVKRLARALSAATRAPVFHRAGGPDDLCEFVWILCVGREPALVESLDETETETETEPESVRDVYLRVAFSSIGRVACVQQVTLEREGAMLRALPEPGVYDPQLLKRLRAVVDLIEAHDIEHLDFGLCDKPVEGARARAYEERFGVSPAVVNYLFYAQPARTRSETAL